MHRIEKKIQQQDPRSDYKFHPHILTPAVNSTAEPLFVPLK